MAGPLARSGHRGARTAVSPPRRGAVSAGRDRARLDAKRAASRANAAAGIPRTGGVAGGAGFCRAGTGTPGPWRDRWKIPRKPGRMRRGRLFPLRPRHGGCDRFGAGLSAQAILHTAGRRRGSRALGRRLGRAGFGRRESARRIEHHCVRAGTRRPCQRLPQPGLRAAHAAGVGGRVRQQRARAGDMAGGGQRQLFFAHAVAAAGRCVPRRWRQSRLSRAGAKKR